MDRHDLGLLSLQPDLLRIQEVVLLLFIIVRRVEILFADVAESLYNSERRWSPYVMRVVRYHILNALQEPCCPSRQGVGCLSRIFLSLVLAHIGEVCDASHEVRTAYCSVGSLAPHVLIVPCEMRVEMLLQSHVPNEPEPADTALKLYALINFSDCENIKPKTLTFNTYSL